MNTPDATTKNQRQLYQHQYTNPMLKLTDKYSPVIPGEHSGCGQEKILGRKDPPPSS